MIIFFAGSIGDGKEGSFGHILSEILFLFLWPVLRFWFSISTSGGPVLKDILIAIGATFAYVFVVGFTVSCLFSLTKEKLSKAGRDKIKDKKEIAD